MHWHCIRTNATHTRPKVSRLWSYKSSCLMANSGCDRPQVSVRADFAKTGLLTAVIADHLQVGNAQIAIILSAGGLFHLTVFTLRAFLSLCFARVTRRCYLVPDMGVELNRIALQHPNLSVCPREGKLAGLVARLQTTSHALGVNNGVVRRCSACCYGFSFGLARAGVFRERSQKWPAHAGATDLAFENVAKGYKFPVQNPGFVFILRHRGST